MPSVGDALHIAVYVLAGVAAVEAGALVVLWQLLARSRREVDELRQRAVELATGPDGRLPFNLEQEPAKVRDRYGRHPLGQYLLMARRLVESGVGFVSVNGWCGFAPGEGS